MAKPSVRKNEIKKKVASEKKKKSPSSIKRSAARSTSSEVSTADALPKPSSSAPTLRSVGVRADKQYQACKKASPHKDFIHLQGTTPNELIFQASIQDMVAVCQYAAFQLQILRPNVYDAADTNEVAGGAAAITPTGFASYCLMAIIQAFQDMHQYQTTITNSLGVFPRDSPVFTPIAEFIRHYIVVHGTPTIKRFLNYTSDMTISNSNIAQFIFGQIDMSLNQYTTGSGLSLMGVACRQQNPAVLDMTLAQFNVGYTGVYGGTVPFAGSVEFKLIQSTLSSWTDVGYVLYDKIQITAPDYSGFVFPYNGVWSTAGYCDSPSPRYNPELAPIFTPNAFTLYPTRQSPHPLGWADTIPNCTLQFRVGNSNPSNGMVIPPGQTIVSQNTAIFFSLLCRSNSLPKGKPFGARGHKFYDCTVTRFARIVSVPVDTFGIVTSMMTAAGIKGTTNDNTNMSVPTQFPALIYQAATAAVVRKILNCGQLEYVNSFGCSGNSYAQLSIPDQIWLESSYAPSWVAILNTIGPVMNRGTLYVPSYTPWNSYNGLTVPATAYDLYPKLGLVNTAGLSQPPASYVANVATPLINTNFPYVMAGSGLNSVAAVALPSGPGGVAAGCYQYSVNLNPLAVYNAGYKTAMASAKTAFGSVEPNLFYSVNFASAIVATVASFFAQNSTGGRGGLIPPSKGNMGWVNMLSVTLAPFSPDALTTTIGLCAVPVSDGQQTTLISPITNYTFNFKRIESWVHLSPAKIALTSAIPLCVDYTYISSKGTAQSQVTTAFSFTHDDNNVGRYAYNFLTECSIDGGAIVEHMKQFHEKRKLQKQYDGAPTTKSPIPTGDKGLRTAVKDYAIDNSEAFMNNDRVYAVDDIVKSIEAHESGKTGDGLAMRLADEQDGKDRLRSEDDFNWKKAAKTGAEVGAKVLGGLAMCLV